MIPTDILAPTSAYFDSVMEAWVVTRYVDVLAALRDRRLVAGVARSGGELSRAAHLRFRAQSSIAASAMLQRLPREESLARTMARALPTDRPVDLVNELAAPWSVQIAHHVARPAGNPERLTALAGDLFAAAAEPRNTSLQERAQGSTLELAAAFPGEFAAFRLQAFVALSQTLPCFLANSWLALLNDPESAEVLRANPSLMPAAIEELLRHSGPSRAQFRHAADAVTLGEASIAKGDSIALMLAAANRDPAQFPEPDKLDFRRCAPDHLALGGGKHACIGAELVRAASAAATTAFIEYFAGARLEEPVQWRGGFAIRAPACLRVSR
jgi:cytochrome P450